MITIFGIKNCDTVKKALKWLEAQGTPFQFHDFRKDGIDKAMVRAWLDSLGAQALVNKRSTTWKSLSDKDKSSIDGPTDVLAALIVENPTLIKRPLLNKNKQYLVGFKQNEYQAILENQHL